MRFIVVVLCLLALGCSPSPPKSIEFDGLTLEYFKTLRTSRVDWWLIGDKPLEGVGYQDHQISVLLSKDKPPQTLMAWLLQMMAGSPRSAVHFRSGAETSTCLVYQDPVGLYMTFTTCAPDKDGAQCISYSKVDARLADRCPRRDRSCFERIGSAICAEEAGEQHLALGALAVSLGLNASAGL